MRYCVEGAKLRESCFFDDCFLNSQCINGKVHVKSTEGISARSPETVCVLC